MKIDAWLRQSQKRLESAGIGTARLDALVLLEDVTGRDRAWLLAYPEHDLKAADARKLTNLLNHRSKHEPLAYLRGKTEFYGREFVINHDVLEPRPESETMIDCLESLPILTSQSGTQVKIADIGTGSGALGITAALEFPNTRVDLLDIDPKALKVAKMNVEKFTLKLDVIKNDLLTDFDRDYDILLCNLPYVPDSFQINPAAMHEPRTAIFGAADGLDLYRKLFHQLKTRANKPLYILIEALPLQHADLHKIASSAGYNLTQTKDFIQVFTTSKLDVIA